MIEPDKAAERLAKRNQAPDRLEQENRAFFQRIDAGYRQRAQTQSHVQLIDAAGSPEQVFARISPLLQELCRS